MFVVDKMFHTLDFFFLHFEAFNFFHKCWIIFLKVHLDPAFIQQNNNFTKLVCLFCEGLPKYQYT